MEGTVILVINNGMGNTDEKLGQLPFRKYLELLFQNGNLPHVICFYTEGVKLVCEGSPVLNGLHQLENKGVGLIAWPTCLNYFEITEKVQVGIVGGLGDILEAQWKAEKVITI